MGVILRLEKFVPTETVPTSAPSKLHRQPSMQTLHACLTWIPTMMALHVSPFRQGVTHRGVGQQVAAQDVRQQQTAAARTRRKVSVQVRAADGRSEQGVYVNKVITLNQKNMSVLLSYDIKATSTTIHTELRQRLIDHYGYSPSIQATNGTWHALPNTTLRKDNITTQQAAVDFTKACQDVSAYWQRYAAVEFSNRSVDSRN